MATYYESSAPPSDTAVYGDMLRHDAAVRSHEHAGVHTLGRLPPCEHREVHEALADGHIAADRVHFVQLLECGRMGVNIWEAHLSDPENTHSDTLRKALVVVNRAAHGSVNPAGGVVRRELEVHQQLQGNLAHVPELFGGCIDHPLPYLVHEYFPCVTFCSCSLCSLAHTSTPHAVAHY